jgi:hypothetical protein
MPMQVVAMWAWLTLNAFSPIKTALVQLTLHVNRRGIPCRYAKGYTFVQTKHIKAFSRLHLRQT